MADGACWCGVSGIHLVRGNHESKNMNRIYGFEGEVKAKVSRATPHSWLDEATPTAG